MRKPGEHIDPTTEISLETVKNRTVKGVFVLTGRTFVLNVIAFIAQGFLWAYLSPNEFGVFWIVSAIVNFLAYFSDIGLAAALIQKKEKPTRLDLETTFTVQQILVITLLVALFFIAPSLERIQSLSGEGRMLMYALGISFFLSSLKSIPSVLLERKLEFNKFIIPQVIENLVYNIIVVVLAINGFGISSFTYAVLARGVVGLVAIYILEPWTPGIALSRKSLKNLMSFGLPYQANTLLAVIKDDGMTIMLGSILGPSGVGILGTAQRLAQYPLRFFMDNVTKVTFPAFSRMQDDKDHLKRSVTRSIFFITFLVFPSIIGLAVIAPAVIKVIPRYGKWEPALIPLALLTINVMFASITTQLTNLLNAIGKIKTTFKLMVMWTVLTLTLIPYLSLKLGVNGAALGYALIGTSSIIAIFVAKRYVNFSLIDSTLKPLLASLVMGVVVFFLRNALPVSATSLLVLVATGAVTYISVIFALIGATLIEDAKKGFKNIFSK